MRETVAPRPLSRPLLVAAGTGAFVVATAILLWSNYGATVFFETIRADFVACFG